MFFEKEEVTDEGDIDFEIVEWGTSVHLHWGLKKMSYKA